ncbi:RNA polymerase II transcriptional coactivator KIWI-like [Tripterygium wilfordii]|uniref:RNA polymerase II transcriptional coactivator KIWI-like n=1 Tax=Tripterygium wilfordii TaxID=458696 RepID=A0A7J7DFG9_TRIWF|nr:RNA polymerase II transcriptional coactivator KIWI-like [Tripterygium wilfordii]
MSSFRGKRKDEDYASDDNAEAHAPRKKISKAQSSDDSDDVVVCEISKNRRVSVRNWQGKVWVDIREFYIKDGKQYPGKKGSCLFAFFYWLLFTSYVYSRVYSSRLGFICKYLILDFIVFANRCGFLVKIDL